MSETIWLVWADRGCYSDHTQYSVCWFETEGEAKACAQRMFQASCRWRGAVSSNRERWENAIADIGDPAWSPYDDTEYTAVPLTRGTAR